MGYLGLLVTHFLTIIKEKKKNLKGKYKAGLLLNILFLEVTKHTPLDIKNPSILLESEVRKHSNWKWALVTEKYETL